MFHAQLTYHECTENSLVLEAKIRASGRSPKHNLPNDRNDPNKSGTMLVLVQWLHHVASDASQHRHSGRNWLNWLHRFETVETLRTTDGFSRILVEQ